MVFRGVNFWLAPDGYLEVRVHPDWRLERDDDQRSLDDMSFARNVAEEISDQSPRFASASDNLPWRFVKLDETGTEIVYLYCPDESKLIWSLGAV